jgi:aminoglycoside phosphotransferase (APT) family kinase protein
MSEKIAVPPFQLPEIHRGVWCSVPEKDPSSTYIACTLWDQQTSPVAWEVARLSNAVYLYRETATTWAVVVKFYGVKTDVASAQRHAEREFENTMQARACCPANAQVRTLQPLAVWKGALFLEYVEGLTLEDVIAIRRHRPGTLLPSLTAAAEFLATTHVHGRQSDSIPAFEEPPAKAMKIVQTLVEHGVLHDDPVISEGLQRLISRWAVDPTMREFVPTFIHGDATTTNFIFPWNGGVVGIDWERFKIADPAADLGRLLAEISHSLKQHGGSLEEAVPDLDHTIEAYCQKLPADWNLERFLMRTRFYRAISTLRIARNGWVSRLDRTALVAQALALLSSLN